MNDAHNHLQDQLFDTSRKEVIKTMLETGIKRCVVNGTRPRDWQKVQALAIKHPSLIIPSYGLHPWFADDVSTHANWFNELQKIISSTPNACIGECGLDKNGNKSPLDLQVKIFKKQLTLAAKNNLPLSIHCIKSWGLLIDILSFEELPKRGFLLHSYTGSPELVPQLTELGAYFSFSASILFKKKEKIQALANVIPHNRLLIETDAPNMLPPNSHFTYTIKNNTSVNHPANLTEIKDQLACFFNLSSLSKNFTMFFSAI